MFPLVLSDLRHSIRIWIGSLAVLAVTQLACMWAAGIVAVGIHNQAVLSGASPEELASARLPNGESVPADIVAIAPTAMTTFAVIAFLIVWLVASITVRNVVNAIVYQRRRTMALWQLAGMTDRQLLRILRLQVTLLSSTAFAGSTALALASAPWLLQQLRTLGVLFDPPMSTAGVFTGYAAGGVVGAVVCILAVRGAGAELRAISPLEAIRSEGVRELPMTVRRWVGVAIWTVVFALTAWNALTTTTLQEASLLGLLAGVLGVVILNTGGPVLLIGLMRGWTRLVPDHASASWLLARTTLRAASARTVASIGSISVAVLLFTALFSQGEGADQGSNIAGFILLVGFPLMVSVVGSVVLVFMAGQQREREIHLAELAGATPTQQRRQALFEAVIVVATGSGIGLFFCLVVSALEQPAALAETGAPTFTVSLGNFAGITVTLLLLNVIASVLPTVLVHAARDRIAVPASV